MTTKALWHWSGLNAEGELVQGTSWEAQRQDVMLALLEQHIHLLSLKRQSVRARLWRGEHSCEIMRQLATLLQAGLTLPESLRLLANQQPAVQWQALLHTLAAKLEMGEPFSTALAQWPDVFPPLYLAMVNTGELTGNLDECCFKLADQQKAQLLLARKVKKALRYPLIILTLAFMVVLAMVYLVLPEFATIYQTFNTPLPALTRGVIALASLMQQCSIPLLLLTLMGAGMLAGLRRHRGWQRYRQRVLLACPQLGQLVRGQRLSQIFTVLALTQRSGIAFLQGLESVANTLNCPWWQEKMTAIHQEIVQGQAISTALATSGMFTPLCIQLVRTGEASGALDTMLQNLAHHHSEQTSHQADNLASLLEPLLLVVTGIIIGTLVVAMYLPIFHLGDAMSGVG
ncbi:protein transport protein HofC [Yokenella regensburgei]|uniref:protein transport protein HofC n=1 Tax=Yokenella regensburgei TaxID=158877 RepID=UPI003F15CBA1